MEYVSVRYSWEVIIVTFLETCIAQLTWTDEISRN